MLKELKIQNMALIEELHITLEKELIVLTGETGAGKSIVLQAIALLSGARASASWVRTGTEKAVVEALFGFQGNRVLVDDLLEMGVDCDGELLIKRVLSRTGKSRFYLNGSLSTARLVSKVSEYLVSVASQHDHQQLLIPRYHLDFVDLVGELWPDRVALGSLYDEWVAVKNELDELRVREMEKEQRRDFLGYQFNEINEAALKIGEDEELNNEKNRLKSSDDLKRLGHKCFTQLRAAADSLGQARKNIDSMAELDPAISEVAESVIEHSFIAEEFADNLQSYMAELPMDNGRLEEVSARIHLLQQLKRKYGEDLAEVIAYARKAELELAELEAMDDRLEVLSANSKKLSRELTAKAKSLSVARHQVARELGEAVRKELHSLSFEQADFELVFNNDEDDGIDGIGRTGWDKVEFMFSANPGEPKKPLVKIASGGELSRVMLALKCLLARKDLVETVIFDEVDAGIGGKAAEAVARKIKELSKHHQVMCITHLPQIAACGRSHFMVEKRSHNGRTHTSIAGLSAEQRVSELARMLDGDSVSEQSFAFARDLIERNVS